MAFKTQKKYLQDLFEDFKLDCKAIKKFDSSLVTLDCLPDTVAYSKICKNYEGDIYMSIDRTMAVLALFDILSQDINCDIEQMSAISKIKDALYRTDIKYIKKVKTDMGLMWAELNAIEPIPDGESVKMKGKKKRVDAQIAGLSSILSIMKKGIEVMNERKKLLYGKYK